jgi:hypothetical protein
LFKDFQRFEGQLNVMGFKEGWFLSLKSLGYDVLQKLNLCKTYKRFFEW